MEGKDKLLYLGRASLRIVTRENKVIYIDPYAGDDYNLAADLILVTHGHFDHNDMGKVINRNEDVQIITFKEALRNGEYYTFDLGYLKVEAVEAGYNKNHDKNECVGFIITLSSGVKIYVAGDTSMTPQMGELAEQEIDYAFFPTDGVYTMTAEEAARAADLVGAKHSVPYHMMAESNEFNQSVADRFDAKNKLLIRDGEEIELMKGA